LIDIAGITFVRPALTMARASATWDLHVGQEHDERRPCLAGGLRPVDGRSPVC
jgi:hypothetical protein